MTQFKRVYLTHANLNKKLHLVAGTIAGYHYSDSSGATHVYTPAGIFPAKETPEEIDGLLDQLTNGGSNEQQPK